MSFVDTALAAATRESYLDEVRYWLPSLLSSATDERRSPVESVEDLLHLDPSQLRRVIAVHLLLSEEVQQFIAALPRALRAPMTRSERPRELSRVISGGIDWAATIRARSTSSPIEGGFVTRPSRRVWDIEENRALVWVLRSLNRELDFAAAGLRGSSGADWQRRIELAGQQVNRARRTAWLRSIPSDRPSLATLAQLSTSRTLFYRTTLPSVARLLRRYADAPSANDVAELLTQRWFEPSRDWALFELVVLLRLERALSSLGKRRRLRLISARSAFSVIDVAPQKQIRIWYQNWPGDASGSELIDAARHYRVNTVGTRPDVVIEVAVADRSSGILVECKATRSSEYLGSGLLQMLGYLRDRPAMFGREACAWLVAPVGAPMDSRPPEDRELWVVDDAGVADAAVAAACRLLGE